MVLVWYHNHTHFEIIELWFINKYDSGNLMQADLPLLGSDVGQHNAQPYNEKAITNVFLVEARLSGVPSPISRSCSWWCLETSCSHLLLVKSVLAQLYSVQMNMCMVDVGSTSIILAYKSQTKQACVYCYPYEWTFTAYVSLTLWLVCSACSAVFARPAECTTRCWLPVVEVLQNNMRVPCWESRAALCSSFGEEQ